MTTQFCYIAFHQFLTVHITKDTGKIPQVIGRIPGWQARILRFNNEQLNFQKQAEPPFEIITQKTRKIWKIDINLIWYLVKHASQIDVLLLYHFDFNTHFYGVLYKFLNRNGFLWNKLDLNEDVIRDFPKMMKIRKPISQLITRNLIRIFLRNVNLMSLESSGTLNLFQIQFPDAVKKIICLPNGVDTATMPEVENITREQIILTVARLGAWEKGTDILLDAFAQSKVWPEWKLVLVGQVEENFQPWIEDFKKRYPLVWKSILWVNYLDSRIDIARWYQMAMIFCLPSRSESFPHGLLEAGYYGCACITSDYTSANDILDNGNCGVIFPKGQTEELAKQLKNLCQDQQRIHLFGTRVKERIRSKFCYEELIKKWYEEYKFRRKKNRSFQ